MDKEEISENENAINKSEKSTKLIGVKLHIEDALKKIGDRSNPDYRNSIKESISAVESLINHISDRNYKKFSSAIRSIKEKIDIHPAIVEGFIKIYGYTSNKDGIRHAMLDKPDLDQEDARYMLIACSAFINYLIEKASKADIKLH